MTSAAAGPVVVAPERGRSDRKAFLDLPYRLYRGHPTWVPPLRMADAKLMDRRKNPFFAHAEAEHFLARRGGRVVGPHRRRREPAPQRGPRRPRGLLRLVRRRARPGGRRARSSPRPRAWVGARGMTAAARPRLLLDQRRLRRAGRRASSSRPCS